MAARWDSPAVALARTAAAATLLIAASAAFGGRAGEVRATGSLELSCRDGRVALEARGVPAAEVFRQLEARCGVAIRSPELLPTGPITVVLRARELEEAVRELVRIAAIPSTLSASGPGGPLTLYLLPTGKEGPAPASPASPPGAAGAGAGADAAAGGGPGAAGGGAADGPEALLAALGEADPDQVWILTKMAPEDLLEERDDAATEDLLRRILAAADEEERARLLAKLNAIGPSPVTGRPWTPADVADERWRLSWVSARRDYLLAADEPDRREALGRVRALNDAEAEHLEGLEPEELERERAMELVDELRERYLLSRAREEWERLLGEERRRAPTETP